MSGISMYGNMNYTGFGYNAAASPMFNGSGAGAMAGGSVGGALVSGAGATGVGATGNVKQVSDAQLKAMKRSGAVECATCASRKYQDGSNEGDVSFKAAAHISPGSAAGKVMAHEQEHVANAHEKAGKLGGKVMMASVKIQTAVCPECGRSYVAGGVTNTAIKYPKDSFSQNKKSADYDAVAGKNIDYKV